MKELIDLVAACPINLKCCDFHHAKADQHGHGEVCKPMDRYYAALEQAQRRIGAEAMNKLFSDLKTDEEKSNFFLMGRGYETGVIALAIQNDVAMAYRSCSEYAKEIQALRRDAERMRDALKEAASELKCLGSEIEDIYSKNPTIVATLPDPNVLPMILSALEKKND